MWGLTLPFGGTWPQDGFEPSITFDADQREFKICFATNESNGPVAACALRYHPLAIASSHGTVAARA
jgi:hypothetical protein